MAIKIYKRLTSGTDADYTLNSTLADSATSETVSGLTAATGYTFKIVREIGGVQSTPVVATATTDAASGGGYNAPQTGDITFTDADFNYSVPGYAKTGYTARSTAGYVEFRTTETALDIKIGGNWSGKGFNQSDIDILVDGVYNQSVTLTADDVTQTKSITLPAGTKLVRLVNGYTVNGDTITLPLSGVFVQGVVTTGNIEVKVPSVSAHKKLFVGDSITTGAVGDHPAISSYATQFRSADGWDVQIDSWGARTLDTTTQGAADTMAAFLVAQMNGTSTNEMFLALGTNNWGLIGQSKAAFKNNYQLLIDTIHALRSDITIWCISPIDRASSSTPNAGGAILEDYADAIRELLQTRSWAKFIYGQPLVDTVNLMDGVHPGQAGHDEYHDNLLVRYLAGGDSVGAGNTTPAAPTIIADDTADTLSATHVLGDSEILESENNGTYVAYSGAKTIGDVALTAGYWKFKIKAATGRNESAVAESPAFTVAGGASAIPSDWVWHLDPATVTKDGSNKVSAADLGNTHTATMATATKQPLWVASGINSLPVLRFDGVDDALTSAYNELLGEFTIIAVVKAPSIQSGLTAFVEHTFRYGLRLVDGEQFTGLIETDDDAATAINAGSAFDINVPQVLGSRYKTGQFDALYKGSIVNLSNDITGDLIDTSYSGSELTFGAFAGGAGSFSNADLGDIYFFNRALTDTEWMDAKTALQAKYATTY